MIETILRMTIGAMAGSIFYRAQKAEDWGIVVRILILFIAFLVLC